MTCSLDMKADSLTIDHYILMFKFIQKYILSDYQTFETVFKFTEKLT